MSTMIRILFLFWIPTRHAQITVSWTVGTSLPKYKEDLKLTCTVSSGCCTSSNRIWKDGTGAVILINEISSFPDKYAEDWNPSNTTSFSLIIKDLDPKTDVWKDYECQYSIGSDKHNLTPDASWEYKAPRALNAMTINTETELTGTVDLKRLAPFPNVTASYGGKDVTSDLKLTGPTLFETYFYTLKVSIDMKVDCHRDDRFTMSVVTGTETVNVCDNQDLCKCLSCFAKCFLISLAIPTIGFVLCLIYLRIKQKLLIKGCVLTLGCILLRLVLVHYFATSILNLMPTFLLGYFECPCKEYYFWILNILWSLLTGLICILVVCFSEFDWNYILGKDIGWKCKVLVLGFISGGISILIAAAFDEKMFKSGKSQSVESGSPEKERADKKKERKPTEVVRPQPSRPLPSRAQHLKTDNTGREEYSAENELFKPRPLPSISGHSDSPRPLPKRTPDDQLEKGGIQLEPLVDSTSEKKKKKKRKKKETKQSDEDD